MLYYACVTGHYGIFGDSCIDLDTGQYLNKIEITSRHGDYLVGSTLEHGIYTTGIRRKIRYPSVGLGYETGLTVRSYHDDLTLGRENKILRLR